MEAQYRAVAALNDGQEIRISGNIMECANWADNVIRANGGEINIFITRIDEK